MYITHHVADLRRATGHDESDFTTGAIGQLVLGAAGTFLDWCAHGIDCESHGEQNVRKHSAVLAE